ncbi:MAG: hypothetical protein HYX46_02635 [Betaproteobacteria bacterium]|nr:hypothetical protein [Betaproteobacteria bacterium]
MTPSSDGGPKGGFLVELDLDAPPVCRTIERVITTLLEFIVMTTIRNLFAIAFATSIAFAAVAQAQSAPAASAPMMGGNTMPHDCAKPMAKHDHGAEKGTPRPMSMTGPCAAGAAATAPEGAASAAKTKKLPKHNHGAEKNN